LSNVIQAKERTEFRNSALTRLREEGNIPAVVYGAEMESKAVYFNGAEFFKTIREVGRNGVMSLELNGKKFNVILSDYQSDPIKREIVHADFLAVDMSTEINASVRLVLTGEATGVKDGGVLQQPLYEVSITSTPANIPSAIEVDVTSLQVGETITIGEIRDRFNFLINHEDFETIASILPPKQEEEIDTGEQQEEGKPENEEGRETKAAEE
jgi:large subunit ribosomal protein L25